jgi:hypothetical protein
VSTLTHFCDLQELAALQMIATRSSPQGFRRSTGFANVSDQQNFEIIALISQFAFTRLLS